MCTFRLKGRGFVTLVLGYLQSFRIHAHAMASTPSQICPYFFVRVISKARLSACRRLASGKEMQGAGTDHRYQGLLGLLKTQGRTGGGQRLCGDDASGQKCRN